MKPPLTRSVTDMEPLMKQISDEMKQAMAESEDRIINCITNKCVAIENSIKLYIDDVMIKYIDNVVKHTREEREPPTQTVIDAHGEDTSSSDYDDLPSDGVTDGNAPTTETPVVTTHVHPEQTVTQLAQGETNQQPLPPVLKETLPAEPRSATAGSRSPTADP